MTTMMLHLKFFSRVLRNKIKKRTNVLLLYTKLLISPDTFINERCSSEKENDKNKILSHSVTFNCITFACDSVKVNTNLIFCINSVLYVYKCTILKHK